MALPEAACRPAGQAQVPGSKATHRNGVLPESPPRPSPLPARARLLTSSRGPAMAVDASDQLRPRRDRATIRV